MKKLNTIFMGNPEFCLTTLNTLLDNPKINLIAVCGGMDKKVGRGQKLTSPATIDFAKKNNIHFIQSENINKSDEFFSFVDKNDIDLIIVFAFSHFLSKKILEIPNLGCFNFHTSLLPKYRGSSPIHYALLNNDKITGISIQRMVKQMDAGDVLISHEILIDPKDDYSVLCQKIFNTLPMVTNKFIETLTSPPLKFTIQDENNVSFAPLIKKEDGLINPSLDSYEILVNKIRAFSVWPGVYCYINNQRTKIHEIKNSMKAVKPGKILIEQNNILLGLKNDTIEISCLQPPGKKPMTNNEYINGLKGVLDLTFSMNEEI